MGWGAPPNRLRWRREKLRPLHAAWTVKDLGQELGEIPLSCAISPRKGVASKGIGEMGGVRRCVSPPRKYPLSLLRAGHGCPSGCVGRCGAGLDFACMCVVWPCTGWWFDFIILFLIYIYIFFFFMAMKPGARLMVQQIPVTPPLPPPPPLSSLRRPLPRDVGKPVSEWDWGDWLHWEAKVGGGRGGQTEPRCP